MKYLKYFLLIILQFAIVELVIWVHTNGIWHIEELAPSDAISLWGTVTTIVFLVFSVLALWNIDQKIQELNEMKRSIGEKFNSIENKSHEVMLEADKAQRDIVKKAEEQIKRSRHNVVYNLRSIGKQYKFSVSPTIAMTKDLWRKIMDEVSVSEVI